MFKLAVLFLLSALSFPALSIDRVDAKHADIKRVSVKQLEQALTGAAGNGMSPKADHDLAGQLASMELTERLSTENLNRLKVAMPGEESARTLIALADASAFLGLPVEDVPNSAPPEKEDQQQAMNAASAYVAQVLQKLPDIFASESVMTFQEFNGMKNESGSVAYHPVHYAGTVKINVRYLDNKELVDSGKGELTEVDQLTSRLLFSGEFGPVLDTVFRDTQGKFEWSHWETGPLSDLAVFRYAVPRNKSHCKVKVVMPGAQLPTQARPGYHGEISIDLSSGTIYRLTLIADLSADDPMSRANMAVEYGPVEIAGSQHICPIHSIRQVTQTAGRTAVTVSGGSNPFGASHDSRMSYTTTSDVPSQTLLNDTNYESYHLFRAETRVIPSDDKPETPQQ
jgi:hypothetical protein